MKIKFNGQKKNINDGASIETAINEAGLCKDRVVVSVNDKVIEKRRFSETILNDGDVIEVLSFVGGG
jgi:sulfur carrier protein